MNRPDHHMQEANKDYHNQDHLDHIAGFILNLTISELSKSALTLTKPDNTKPFRNQN